MKPRASFVIPAFNAQTTLSKALLSCRTQTIKQIEIIVVNDGSTDGTKSILDAHVNGNERIAADPRIIPIHLEKNVGVSEARNIGNARASSDLIFVLDSDDMAARNRVKDTLTIFELKKPDFVYGSFFTLDSFGNVDQKIVSEPFDPDLSKKKKLNFICHSTVAYRKSVAEVVKYEGGDFSKLGLDDWKFQWDVYRKGFTLKNIKTPIAYLRQSPNGLTAKRDPKEVLRVKDEYLATL